VTGSSAASTPLPDLKTLQRKLADNRQEVRNLQVMQMRPGQSAEKLELLHNLERSARASAKLRRKAIQYWWSVQKVKHHRKRKRRCDPHQLDLFDRHCASQKQGLPPTPKLVISDEQIQRVLDGMRRELRNPTVTGMHPDPKKAASARSLEEKMRGGVKFLKAFRERQRAGRQV
jgi:hypothetical protein